MRPIVTLADNASLDGVTQLQEWHAEACAYAVLEVRS